MVDPNLDIYIQLWIPNGHVEKQNWTVDPKLFRRSPGVQPLGLRSAHHGGLVATAKV